MQVNRLSLQKLKKVNIASVHKQARHLGHTSMITVEVNVVLCRKI